MLIPGERAPDFELPDQHGGHVRLSTLLPDGPVVLFFYPAAMSRGCTAESCHFRDLAQEFRALHATRVGISQDDVSTQQRFDQAHDLGYPLLSDHNGAVATAYGVRRRLAPLPPLRRATFVIDPNRTIVAVIHHEMRMEAHADHALRALQEMA